EPEPKPKPNPDGDERPVIPTTDARGRAFDALAATLAEPTTQEKYDAALREALDHLLDQRYNSALASLKEAQRFNDTELVQREIAKVEYQIRQQEAAQQTARDVRTVIDDGKPEEAARLGADAVKQFGGGGDLSDEIVQQKRQADALVADTLND